MIYTCYFSGLGSRPEEAVSLCHQQPPGFHLRVVDELAPPVGMLWKFMNGRMSFRMFKSLYSRRFDVIDPQQVLEELDGKILVTWEGYSDKGKTRLKDSHRHLVADWLRRNGGSVQELPPSPRKTNK